MKRTAIKRKKPLWKKLSATPKKVKEKSVRLRLIEKLDDLTSKIVRLTGAKGDYQECFTCGGTVLWKLLDCGHFIPRANLSTRWLLDNLRPQCKTCNQFNGGNLEAYEEKLGKDTVKYLRRAGKTTAKFSIPDLIDFIEVAEEKLKKLDDTYRV